MLMAWIWRITLFVTVYLFNNIRVVCSFGMVTLVHIFIKKIAIFSINKS